MPSLNRHEGCIEIDHSASPGIPYDVAIRLGYNANQAQHLAGGEVMRAATLACKHCGGAWLKNPDRVRPRAYCKSCDHYICDGCDLERAAADYVHRCREEKLEAVRASAHHGTLFDELSPKSPTIFVP